MPQQRRLKEVQLDHLAGKIQSAREARQQAAELIAFAEQLEAEIKEAAGDAERIVVFGVPMYTYSWKNAYRLSEFEADHPHIARQYKTTVEKEVLDKDRLIAEQGDLLRQYQSREFRAVNRKPGT